MSHPNRADATDALALVQALRLGDERAVSAVLTSANTAAVAVALARLLPRAVRTQASVDDFLRGLTDGVLGTLEEVDHGKPPVLPVASAVAAAEVITHLRALLGVIEAGELAAEQWQVGWLVGVISVLAMAGRPVSNRSH